MILCHMEPGKCRFCGCGGDSCRLPDGDLCVWLDSARDTCNNIPCILARDAARQRLQTQLSAARRRRTPAPPHEAMKAKKAKSRKGGGKRVL